jgi:hypothetical protein
MLLCTPLGVWGSVGLRSWSLLSEGHVLLPTKTSRFWNQFSGSVPLRCKSFSHVFLASLVKLLSLVVLWAVIRSVVNPSFIARCHHLLLSN